MPNWVSTKIKLDGNPSGIKKVLDTVKSPDSDFDFRRLLDIPKELEVESGSRSTRGMGAWDKMLDEYKAETGKTTVKVSDIPKDFEEDFLASYDINSEDWELGRQCMLNIEKYGAPTWYEWSINNWGTKWNASAVEVDGNEIRFDTAWDYPEPIMMSFGKLCEDNGVYISEGCFMDEGWNFAGFVYDDGAPEYIECDLQNPEFREVISSLWGDEYLSELDEEYGADDEDNDLSWM